MLSFDKLEHISAKLPKWFGERPGKKSGDPETPDDEEEAGGEAPGNQCIQVFSIF